MSFPYIEPDPEGQTERMSQRKFSSVLSDEKLNAKNPTKIVLNIFCWILHLIRATVAKLYSTKVATKFGKHLINHFC